MTKVIKSSKKNIRVAISSMVRKPLNFDTWLEYHFKIGVDHIFLRVEESPELKKIIYPYKRRITAEFIPRVNKKNHFRTIERQKKFVNHSLLMCRKMKIGWLFHIDSDELIFLANHRKIDKIFNIVPRKCSYVFFYNYEAVVPEENLTNPFLQTNKFYSPPNYYGYKSYWNGKPAARVSSHQALLGPHAFKGKAYTMPRSQAVILHYFRSTFEHWFEQFSAARNIEVKKLKKIPFEFYKISNQLISEAHGIKNKKLLNWYKKQMVYPYYNDPNTITVNNILLRL